MVSSHLERLSVKVAATVSDGLFDYEKFQLTDAIALLVDADRQKEASHWVFFSTIILFKDCTNRIPTGI